MENKENLFSSLQRRQWCFWCCSCRELRRTMKEEDLWSRVVCQSRSSASPPPPRLDPTFFFHVFQQLTEILHDNLLNLTNAFLSGVENWKRFRELPQITVKTSFRCQSFFTLQSLVMFEDCINVSRRRTVESTWKDAMDCGGMDWIRWVKSITKTTSQHSSQIHPS